MKKIIALLSAFIVLMFSSTAQANFDMSNPYQLANDVAVNTVKEIKANKDKISDNAVAEKIIQDNLFPYIDIKYAAYKVMGTSLKTLSKEDREKFTNAFEKYMKQSFVSVLSKYTNQEIVPSEVKNVPESESLVSVKMIIRESGKKDLELVLKMRKNSKTGEWKAFDLIGENISMLDAKVSEISPIIKNQGVDAAIAKLNSTDNK
ncbi:MAG: ABC transporter substrate-binding protein [Succinivibrio dextrinosolvens]|uniref:MlaC/ttg2D family ABC transporter substrate-binding protein n=1 Tax=Succinivibrio sp. TaxID=2053619 RepID=UPI002600E2D9|nr:ABC transporter substrate-binding protein [Succinivibrio sp.]MDY6415378.1 ABC transporter substrate-binding protein [Succinivibrio dextrinosolvens]MBQ9219432.1 ABC transporter substrate-binding protein [Succinivibrio sp.]MDY6420174.1 ABC transporter substrate-binding protein [Succinivibrio dextrinosolvens]MDY6465752.1 ABC transporter substrate-binding protein [Succinivibrio dextrinosolvens]MDY6469496.1 ABC transporter substrate-binding protein [Succinivibrio dextrinosolvens]